MEGKTVSEQNDARAEGRSNRRDKQKQARSRRASAAGAAKWDDFRWDAFQALAEALCRHGGAVRLGQTRDGGAWALGIYLGDDYATEYIKPAEEFINAIGEIVEAWIPTEYENWASRVRQLME